MSMTDTTSRNARRQPRERETREVDFYVRAKTGSGRQDWAPVGVAFKTDSGYSIKMNTIPINLQAWDGVLVLVPPFAEDDNRD